MAKRKLPELLKIRNVCKKEAGVKAFSKETPSQKKEIDACVLRKTK